MKQDKRNNKLKCLKQTRPIDIHTLQLGVLKRDFYSMDCVDLYTEMLFYLRCDILDKCRTCSNLLRRMVPILEEKWDSIRFIDFDEGLNFTKSLKHFVDESSTIVNYYRLHRQFIKNACRRIRQNSSIDRYYVELLCLSNFFRLGNNEYLRFRNFILKHIARKDDIYFTSSVSDDLLLSLF